MCELFAMTSDRPAGVDLCLAEFARHGGLTGSNKDGWGIASYAPDGAVRLIKEAEPASGSEWVEFIKTHRLRSTLVLSHIRRATRGGRSLGNTQPFRRELGGRCHVFAHNGDLPGIEDHSGFALGFHRPLGETDSEYAFCSLLGRLESVWLPGRGTPRLLRRFEIVRRFASALAAMGMANFIYSDGDALFAHGNRRRDRIDEPPRPPGLHLLRRAEAGAPEGFRSGGLQISPGNGHRDMALVASVPLTGEDWVPLEEGSVVVMRQGRVVEV